MALVARRVAPVGTERRGQVNAETIKAYAVGLRGDGPYVIHCHGTNAPRFVCIADTPEDIVGAVSRAEAKGCRQYYVTMNTLKPEWLAVRDHNELLPAVGNTPRDADIERADWIYLDFDPLRKSQTSATADEKEAALEVQQKVLAHLREMGVEPLRTDSGNGYGLFVKLPPGIKPNSPEAVRVKAFVADISARSSTDRVKIDTSVTNAARITRLIGMLNRKGDNTPERPHRDTDFANDGIKPSVRRSPTLFSPLPINPLVH